MKKRQLTLNEEVMRTMFRVLGSLALLLIIAVGIDIAKLFG